MRTGRRPRVWLRRLVAVAGTTVVSFPAAAAGTTREALDLAVDYFLVADYRTALERLTGLLDGRGLTDDRLVQAHVLRARSLVGLGRTESAVAAFCSVLRLDGEWRPDPGTALSTGELAAFHRAVPLSLPPVAPPPPHRAELSPVDTPWLEPARLGIGPAQEARSWYRRPLVLGVAGGVAAGVLILVFDEGAADEPARLPDFPEPPE
ncbi:MAG: hypothetical protein ACT4PE_12195 [Candidatus Eiseniibacteriota bacterium]